MFLSDRDIFRNLVEVIATSGGQEARAERRVGEGQEIYQQVAGWGVEEQEPVLADKTVLAKPAGQLTCYARYGVCLTKWVIYYMSCSPNFS